MKNISRKIFGSLLIFGLIANGPPLVLAQTPVSLIITEIAAIESNGYEWIEIMNTTEAPIDLSGLYFFENGINHGTKIIKGEPVLQGRNYAMIVQDSEKFLEKYPDFSGTLFDSSWDSLKENGEEIGLKDKDKNTLELFIYPPAQNSSLKRLTSEACVLSSGAECWSEEGDPSPGKENFPAVGTSEATPEATPSASSETEATPEATASVSENHETNLTSEILVEGTTESAAEPEILAVQNNSAIPQPKISISEVSFQDLSKDWVEIFIEDSGNEGNGIDLEGYSFTDTYNKKKFTFPAGTIVKSGEYKMISIEDGLSGGTQVLMLKDKEGKGISGVCWSGDPPSQTGTEAIQKLFEDGLWPSSDPTTCPKGKEVKKGWTIGVSESEWQIFQHATPNGPNIFRNTAPQAVITIQSGKTEAEESISINVTGENSYDPDRDELTYFWSFGDTETDEAANPSSHTYDSPGSYILSLEVEDPFGETSEANLEITVLEEKIIDEDESKIEKKQKEERNEKILELLKKVEKRLGSIEKTLLSLQKQFEKGFAKDQEQTRKLEKNLKKALSLSVKKIMARIAKKEKTSEERKTAVSKSKKQEKLTPDGELSGVIRINEIYPAPSRDSGDDEWIELFNPEDRPIRLGNWKLDDGEGGSKPYRFVEEIIPAKGYLVIKKEASKLALNNNSDTVRLFDFQENLIHSVSYETTKQGQSYARTEGNGGAETWEWTSEITPNTQNPRYEILQGMVKSFMPEKHLLTLKTNEGKLYNIMTNENLPAPLIEQNSEAVMKVKPRDEGNYDLITLENLIPPKNEKKFSFGMIAVALILLGILVQIILTIKSFLPKWSLSRTWRPLDSSSSEKDKNG